MEEEWCLTGGVAAALLEGREEPFFSPAEGAGVEPVVPIAEAGSGSVIAVS